MYIDMIKIISSSVREQQVISNVLLTTYVMFLRSDSGETTYGGAKCE